MLVGALVETASVGLIIPALALMAQVDLAANYPRLQPLLDFLGHPSQSQLIGGGMAVLFVVYFVKALFLAFLAWKQNAFIFGVRAILSQRLFTGYLRQPWSFHLQRNSAQLINILANETNQFTASALQPALVLLTEVLVLAGTCMLLIVIEPWGTLVLVSVLGFAAWSFQQLTSSHLLRWGKARQYHESQRIQHVQQGLGGAKDVKLLGREAEFLARYSMHNIGSTRVVEWQNTLQQLPRLWIEVLAVGGLAILVVVMIAQGKPPATMLPTFGLFAVAAFRIMPSANRAIGALQSLRYARPVVDTLHQELLQLDENIVPENGEPLVFCEAIMLEGVGFHYPGAAATALSGITLKIPRGSSVGFVGGSGAGKSTLVDLILGLLTPTTGQVMVDGVDIRANVRGWQDQIGYVPQTVFLTDDSLRRNVAFGLSEDQIDDAAVQRALRAAQLEEFVNSLPEGVQTLVGERGVRLSGGQRQRIGIARALYHDPQVLVLDEATSALDTATEEGVMAAVNTLIGEKTLVIVAHRLSTVARCDRLYRLEKGRIVDEGSFESISQGLVSNG
jgi:ABC-type multidrug transport system fused ATPase/permease subunit